MKPSSAVWQMLSMWPIVGPQLDNIWEDFKSTAENTNLKNLDAVFIVYVSGMLNCLDPKSNFNKKFKT